MTTIAVKLESAWSPKENDWIHISAEELKNYSDLVCPFCQERIFAKRGNHKRHHFAHYSNTNCTPSPETLLHYNAKVFFYRVAKGDYFGFDDEPTHIIVDRRSITNKNESQLLNWLAFDSIKIDIFPITRLSDDYFLENGISLDGECFIPDVLGTSKLHDGTTQYIAIEICVSHPVDENKEKFYKEHNIPFVELLPIPASKAQFKYKVKKSYKIDWIGLDEPTLGKLNGILEEAVLRLY